MGDWLRETAGTLLATDSDPGTAASVTATTLGIGFMMFAFRRLILHPRPPEVEIKG